MPSHDVSDVTNFPEMMDGRVKTLHPMVHGGLLSLRDKPDHAAAMIEHGIAGIDLLVCNLYPFEATVARGADFETTIENIDIGGPAMTRSAAKNHDWVTVVVDVEDYKVVLDEMAANGGATSFGLRKKLAQRAFARTAAYDAAVSNWFAGELEKDGDKEPPRRRAFGGGLRQGLRYGENPHQQAAFYADGSARPGVASDQATSGQGTLLQQYQRHRRGLRAGGGVRSQSRTGLRHHQACQSLRRGAGQDSERGLSGGAGLRSA